MLQYRGLRLDLWLTAEGQPIFILPGGSQSHDYWYKRGTTMDSEKERAQHKSLGTWLGATLGMILGIAAALFSSENAPFVLLSAIILAGISALIGAFVGRVLGGSYNLRLLRVMVGACLGALLYSVYVVLNDRVSTMGAMPLNFFAGALIATRPREAGQGALIGIVLMGAAALVEAFLGMSDWDSAIRPRHILTAAVGIAVGLALRAEIDEQRAQRRTQAQAGEED
jgi:uncharacterized membrane protein YeaQ/YmgE (transglycosylase-associated protein family)